MTERFAKSYVNQTEELRNERARICKNRFEEITKSLEEVTEMEVRRMVKMVPVIWTKAEMNSGPGFCGTAQSHCSSF